MSLSLSREKLLEVVKGSLSPEAAKGSLGQEKINFRGVEYDSREIKGGELFIALKGEKVHGHAFVEQALAKGAALALVEDPELWKTSSYPELLVQVPDTLQAFWALANWWRRELKTPMAAITGSVGKTTVKELTSAILLTQGRGCYSLKSHNNHVGVPYTLCRLSREHLWAVLEMGMNHAGELQALSKLAEPEVTAIVCIAPAHIEFFGTLEAIAKAKLEIIEGSPVGSLLILNKDDALLLSQFQAVIPSGRVVPRYFGSSEGADVSVTDIQTHGFDGIEFTLRLGAESRNIRMGILGRQNAKNAAAATLIAKTLFPNLSLDQVKTALAQFKAPLMRLNVLELGKDRRIIDDSYNANPTSMRAFLEFASDLSQTGKKVGLIVGDMLELGTASAQYHSDIAKDIRHSRPAFVIAVGDHATLLLSEAAAQGIPVHLAPNPEAAGHIAAGLDFDILMLKASRGIGLDQAVKVVMKESVPR